MEEENETGSIPEKNLNISFNLRSNDSVNIKKIMKLIESSDDIESGTSPPDIAGLTKFSYIFDLGDRYQMEDALCLLSSKQLAVILWTISVNIRKDTYRKLEHEIEQSNDSDVIKSIKISFLDKVLDTLYEAINEESESVNIENLIS